MTENFHFEDEDVLDAVVGTDYIKQGVLHMLRGHQCAEKWALYRAIVRLADLQRGMCPTIMPTPFLERLRKIFPPKETPPPDYSQPMMPTLHREPIREIARSFANSIEHDLPNDYRELEALLWTFGEILNGEMERRLAHATKIAQDLIAVGITPNTGPLVSPEVRKHWEMCGDLPPGLHWSGCPFATKKEGSDANG